MTNLLDDSNDTLTRFLLPHAGVRGVRVHLDDAWRQIRARAQYPEGVARIIDYPVIIDATDPLLSGTVGLFNWGTENAYYMNYGGDPGPLVSVVPEPGAFVVLVALGLMGRRPMLPKRRSGRLV